MTLPFAKKSLGQHFLHHPQTLEKIASLAKLTPKDFVLEIGPGPGKLTGLLVERCGTLVAIEKDKRFAEELTKTFEELPTVKIHEADFLETDLLHILSSSASWKVVANLPYNVASPIIFKLLDHRSLFSSLYLMVQKEVADRLTSSPGSKNYSVLSIMSQLYSKNTIVMKLPPGAFQPPPKVHSAIVHFDLSQNPNFQIRNKEVFNKMVRGAFSQRRKMIRNSFQEVFPKMPYEKILEIFNKMNIPETERPENISIAQWVELSNDFPS